MGGSRGRFLGPRSYDGKRMEMSVWEYKGKGGRMEQGKPEVNRSPVHVEVEWAGKPGTEQQKGALTLRGARARRVALWIRHCRYHLFPPLRILPSVSIPSTSRYVLLIILFFFSNTGCRGRSYSNSFRFSLPLAFYI
ncbi:hypothetical protein CDAR_533691 [Caerostris darwini]|uniref:Uncharacterized protein n=1 Tax=Caerostris darwini TaxID=1538125 RepID=A0AAV4S9F9_9ARAC|nr:hypothetical protein CDAR_533691 [Caerostris darwini]